MKLSWNEIAGRALRFSRKWRDTTDEAAEAQSFLNDFFDVFGVDRKRVATFETRVPLGKSRKGYIDLLWKGVILVEMKSRGKSLDKAYAQAKDYAFNLEDEELPDYIMVSDFDNIRLYRNTTGQEWSFKISQLHKRVKLFADLASYKISKETPTDKKVDIEAAENMAKLHDILKSHGYDGHQLKVYLVRLLFCLFADDTGIFEKNIFFDYIYNSKNDGSDLSFRMARLFEVLDSPFEQRVKETMLSEELKRFEYINGSLFSERLPLADFDSNMRKIILECSKLDWGYICPAIFGAMFQGVMNQEERRELGAHYTSEDNIMKVIKPLFLNELWEEFHYIKGNSKKLMLFHERLSKLKFLDPACGCGNFLIITYRELRRLELEVLKVLIDNSNQMVIHISLFCKVNVNQFYGIEIEEFPAQITQVGMWLMDHQMNTLVAEHFGLKYDRLPLRQTAKVVYGNALTIEWTSVIHKNELSYILGNPPFVGKKYQSKNQKEDMIAVFGKNYKGVGNLDYVAAWYKKAAELIQDTDIKVAFVSTNSLVQGEQIPLIWKPLFENYSIHFDFAYKTFMWTSEVKGKAAVHCVIIGFSQVINKKAKLIFDGDDAIEAKNINAYLLDAPDIFIESRNTPICKVPEMKFGNMPIDDGKLILTDDERNELLTKEPLAGQWIRRYMGSYEFINNKTRWCLWLLGANPKDIQKCKNVIDIVKAVRDFRLSSNRTGTIKAARNPTLFAEIRQPETSYIIVPRVSSERRNYVPIGFVDREVISSDAVQIIPDANLYHFGILTSSVHMAWMRIVAGRLKSDFRYSKDIVYNNFPWPNPTDRQKEMIEKATQEVLDSRRLYHNCSLADLYDPIGMPPELVKAHSELDKLVKKAYGYGGKRFSTEQEIVADLMERYKNLSKDK